MTDTRQSQQTTNAIEKQIFLRAPRARVWRALTDAREFGTWFGVSLDDPIEAGKWVSGRITHPGYEHVRFRMLVERMDREVLFAYRWHPYAVDPDVDYSKEPMTLVESGFDRVPRDRRAEAFRMNEQGWTQQMENIRRHVET